MRFMKSRLKKLLSLCRFGSSAEPVRVLVLGEDKGRLTSFLVGSKLFSRSILFGFIALISVGLFSLLFSVLAFIGLGDLQSQRTENQELRAEIFERQAEVKTILGQLKNVDQFNQKVSKALGVQEVTAVKGQGGSEPEVEDLGIRPEEDLQRFAERRRRFAIQRLYLWTSEAFELADRVLLEQDQLFELARSKELQLKATPSIRPVRGYLTSRFGYRSDPFTGRRAFHKGIDFFAPRGRPVMSAAPGEVILARRWGSFGNVVIINHGYGIRSLYAHLEDILVRPGQDLDRGDTIGTVGNTGRSTSTHLHYEIHVNGEAVDPKSFIFTHTDS